MTRHTPFTPWFLRYRSVLPVILAALVAAAWLAGGVAAAALSLPFLVLIELIVRHAKAHARALADAREAEARYRAVIEQTCDGILLCDVGTRQVLEANASLRELVGHSAEGLARRTLDQLVADSPRVLDAWLAQAGRPGGALADLRLHRSDDDVVEVEARGRVIAYGEKAALCAVVRDLTARRRAETLEHDRRAVLERIALNEPLEGTLNLLAQLVERQVPGSVCAVELSGPNGKRVSTSVPMPAGMLGLARLVAAASGEPQVLDFTTDSRAAAFRELAENLDLPGAFVVPVGEGAEPAFFAVFLKKLRDPCLADLAVFDAATKLARSAVQHQDATDQLTRQAYQDELTGLPNRRAFERELRRTLERRPGAATRAAVICIDLDHFKQVNDTLGHAMGDELLKQVGRRLRASLREADLIARMGGDEFMVLVRDVADAETAARIVQKLQDAMRAPFLLGTAEVAASASMGFSLQPADGEDADALQRHADAAMYAAKSSGPGRYSHFGGEMAGLRRVAGAAS